MLLIANYIEYESSIDKNKSLSIKGHLNKIRSCLSDMINDLKTQGEGKIEITMAIDFFKDSKILKILKAVEILKILEILKKSA